MRISINVMKQGKDVLVAACDAELLGKILKFKQIHFEVKEEFYGGSIVSLEKAIQLIKMGTVINIIGQLIVEKALAEGLIHPNAILNISGVPHVQIIKS